MEHNLLDYCVLLLNESSLEQFLEVLYDYFS